MGYFRRRVDRGRSRRLVRRLTFESASVSEADAAWESVPPAPPRDRSFLRFACAEVHEGSGRRSGIFAAAYALLDDPELDAMSRELIEETLRWFDEHLPAPRGFRRPTAVFLFKSSATECTSRIWELVRLLAEHGTRCEMQVYRDPGLLVFEDEYQIAVVPSGASGL